MTTISSNTTALSSLVSLYANSNTSTATDGDGSGSSASSLTGDQTSSVLSMIEGEAQQTSSGLDAMLGAGSDSDDGSDMSAIFDAIDAQMVAGANNAMNAATGTTDGSSTGGTSSTTSTATTEQQKAAAMMQSVYQSQQTNLFTLLG